MAPLVVDPPSPRQNDWAWVLAVTGIFTLVVTIGSAFHEPWRDEVVPLSIVRAAPSLHELAALVKFEGHPILWYLVLWTAYSLVGSTLVLKTCSLGFAICAIIVFLRSCPLPRTVLLLFTFSAMPLYYYSIVSRGYGLEMLLVFSFCTLYPLRFRRPIGLAIALAALANSEFLGFIISIAAGLALLLELLWQGLGQRRGWALAQKGLATLVYLGGLTMAVYTAFPDVRHSGTAVWNLSIGMILQAAGKALLFPAAHAEGLSSILPFLSAWTWAYFLYLTAYPPLLLFTASAIIGIELSFALIYGPLPWHLGNLMLVILAALWIEASGTISAVPPPVPWPGLRRRLKPLLVSGIAVLLMEQSALGILYVINDLGHDFSSSRRLGELLRSDQDLSRAIVMGEPAPPVTSLPYYADNRIYLPREDTFRRWDQWTASRKMKLDLAELLATARRLRDQYNSPIVIALGWDLESRDENSFGWGGDQYQETFEITDDARAEFLAATTRLAVFREPEIWQVLNHTLRANTDERYDVYLLR